MVGKILTSSAQDMNPNVWYADNVCKGKNLLPRKQETSTNSKGAGK